MKVDRKLHLVIYPAVLLLLGWMQLTPPGLLGKTDAVGYAVCHRIASHTYHFGDRPVSLCARCSGQYLGFLLGLIYQLAAGRSRAVRLPNKLIRLVTVGMLLAYLGDGLNSFLSLESSAPQLGFYSPRNDLRFLTGLGAGVALSLYFLPFWNRLVWSRVEPAGVFDHPADWLGLGAAAAGTSVLYLTGNPLVLYPLTLASAAGVIVLLTGAYTGAWVMVLRAENRFQTGKDLLGMGGLGLLTAGLQIALLDWIRYILTGTWSGFHLG